MLLAARGLGIGAALTAGWAGKRRADIKALLASRRTSNPWLSFLWATGQGTLRQDQPPPGGRSDPLDQWEGEKPNSATVAHR